MFGKLYKNLILDYSKASDDIKDLNTFLQKALEKLFPFGKYLFKEGEGTSYTWRFGSYQDSAHGNTNGSSINTNCISLAVNGVSDNYVSYATVTSATKIVATGYNKISFRIKLSKNDNTIKLKCGLTSNSISANGSVAPSFVDFELADASSAAIQTVTLDITNYQGEHYVCVSDASINKVYIAEIYDIYLHN